MRTRSLLSAFATAAILAAPALASAQTASFVTSVGQQPSNVGTITLTQINPNTVNVNLDLLDGYGIINSGGPHTPFAFTIAGSETGISADFLQPSGGAYSFGMFSLSTANSNLSSYGTFGISINSTAGNGSSNGYFGDLSFNVTRTSGLTIDNFVPNDANYYFAADLTNNQNTGTQAWSVRSTTTTATPEPASLALMGTGLLALGGIASRRRRTV